jgi:hypothetical protein
MLPSFMHFHWKRSQINHFSQFFGILSQIIQKKPCTLLWVFEPPASDTLSLYSRATLQGEKDGSEYRFRARQTARLVFVAQHHRNQYCPRS